MITSYLQATMMSGLRLSKEGAIRILRAHDDGFSELLSLEEWKSLCVLILAFISIQQELIVHPGTLL